MTAPGIRWRLRLVQIHRWLSLAMLSLWLLQALTGMICVFHWELDDATIAAPEQPLDLAAITRRLAKLAPPGSGRRVTQMWTSAGGTDRWDVTVSGHPDETVRIDGAGTILRVRRDGELLRHGGLLDTIDSFHQTLLAGDTGSWIMGLSGALLLSNLAIALGVAWPRRGQWQRALAPRGGPSAAARLYGWHRALGLWLVVPAMLLVSTGILRVFSDGFAGMIGGGAPTAPTIPGTIAIDLPEAVGNALSGHPGAKLAAVIFPEAGSATWQIRLVEPGEWSRAYGHSRIFVDGRNGRVIGAYNAPLASLTQHIADDILPVHTGEALGVAGRLIVLAVGAWLAAMIGLGASLWWVRRRLRQRPRKELP